MQFKTALLLLGAMPAAMATLPRTFELLAFQNGQRIGCINGRGNFITGTLFCYPFNSNPDIDPTTVRGYERCSATDGVLSCYEVVDEAALFGLNGADLELSGSGTTVWSADSLPEADDTVGVPITAGGDGSVQFYAQVHAVSG